MDDLSELLKLAAAHQRVGNWDQAERTYRQILAQTPDESAARHGLAWLLHQRGQHGAAIEELRLAIRANPGSAVFHSHLGTMLRQQGKCDEAVMCFRTALGLEPDNAAAQFNLGNAYQQLGQFEAAIESYRASLRGAPADPDIYLNLALALKEAGQFDEAKRQLQQALTLRPGFADGWVNLGLVWKAEGNYIEAKACYEQALRINPQCPMAYNNLGTLLQGQYRIDEAIGYFQEALRINPNYAAAYANLGDAYQAQGKTSEASACFVEALRIAPNDELAIKSVLTLPVIVESHRQIDEARRRLRDELARLAVQELSVRDPVGGVGVPAFYLAYQGYNERDTQRQIAQLLRRSTPSLEFVSPHCSGPAPAMHGRPKIGFISQNFCVHTIGKLNHGLISNLDRERFHVVVLRFPGRDDAMSRAISTCADRVVTLAPQLSRARDQVAEQELDVLFYTDIGMDAMTYYLAHARLASVQCVTWGHPLTTGLPAMDYFISAQDLDAEGAEAHYTETLVRLPHLANYYFRPEVPPDTKTRQDFGLDERAHLYVCPQSLFKLHPDDDATMANILRQDPLAAIVLIEGNQPTWAPLLAARHRRTMGTLADRVHFVPRQSQGDFQRLLALADVISDPLHFGGGNSSYEGFAVGAPIVTLPGAFLRSRITFALYQTMGISDCTAQNRDDYVAKAVRLGTDPAWRAHVRSRIFENNHKIYENPAGVRELEAFLLDTLAAR